MIQITHAGLPMVADTPPMVKSTPAGTPLVTQKASFQVSVRCSSWVWVGCVCCWAGASGACAPIDSTSFCEYTIVSLLPGLPFCLERGSVTVCRLRSG
ncbi:hypothetical protein D3C72_1554710 [compost metagenome]